METGTPFQPSAHEPASEPLERKSGFWHSAGDWLKTIVIAILIALPIRFFIAEPFVVNGASMDPTFSTGQFLIVDRLTYRFQEPSRGDVIVFEYPNDPSVYYIKRVIGLPGESISIRDGRVWIATTSEPKAADYFELDEPYVASLHDSHETVNIAELGSTRYFVMGDNRAESSDSRVWGPLDEKFIIGRPIVRLLPPGSISILPGEYQGQI